MVGAGHPLRRPPRGEVAIQARRHPLRGHAARGRGAGAHDRERLTGAAACPRHRREGPAVVNEVEGERDLPDAGPMGTEASDEREVIRREAGEMPRVRINAVPLTEGQIERYTQALAKGEPVGYVETPNPDPVLGPYRSSPMALEDCFEYCLDHPEAKVVEMDRDVQAEVASVAKEM